MLTVNMCGSKRPTSSDRRTQNVRFEILLPKYFISWRRKLPESHALITLSRTESRAMRSCIFKCTERSTFKWSRAKRGRFAQTNEPPTERPAEAASPSHSLGESDRAPRPLLACAFWPGRLRDGSPRCIPPLVGRAPLSSQYATLKPIRASLLTLADTAGDMQCLASQRTQKLRAFCKVPFA